jgi:putative ABC transport system permease protein
VDETDAGAAGRRGSRGAGAFGHWYAGWRSALRLARRDASKHRGRGALVVLLVGLPVLLISAGLTAFATDDVNPVESLPRVMGQAQAVVSLSDAGVAAQRVLQGPYPMDGGYGTAGPAEREPGVPKRAPWTRERVQRLTGGTVLSTTTTVVRAEVGDRQVHAAALLVDGRQPVTRGMASLTSGRWPRTADEVVVTPEGAAAGLPTSGTITLAARGRPTKVTVVGTGTGWATATAHADLVALPAAEEAWEAPADRPQSFLIARSQPVTWSGVKQLNAHGLLVESRAVFEHPQEAQADPDVPPAESESDIVVAGIVALLVVGILLETVLLAGPAFAVSASRQRRSLALIASNGAPRAQIRRYVLAQAVLLGVFAAVVGAFLGVVAGLLAIRWWAASSHAMNAPGPVDIPVWEVLGVGACASVASLAAAYLPARGASRLDLIGVLRGQGVTARPVPRGLPVIGLVLAGIGGAVLAMNIANDGHEAGIAIGAIVLVAGALMLIPWLLSCVGRLGRRLPLPLRMATRDVGRQRGRGAPAVAAVMVAVTALTVLAIANTSDQAQARRDYQPQAPMGDGLVHGGGPGWPSAVAAVVHRQAPALDVTPVRRVGISQWFEPMSTSPDSHLPTSTTVVRLQKASCAVSPPGARGKSPVVPGYGSVGRCTALGSDRHDRRASIGVVDLRSARDLLHLTDSQVDVLARGGILVAPGREAVHDEHATVLAGTRRVTEYGQAVGSLRDPRVDRIAAATVSTATLDRFGLAGDTGALVTPATAASHHWPTFTDALQLHDPGGPVSSGDEDAITQHLPQNAFLQVERGFQSNLALLYSLLFGVFGTLVLVATLISTALAQAEGRADLGTLAAVGATKRLRRAVAGSQAFVVALVGSLLGLVVGFVPGVALAWPLTVEHMGSYDPATGNTTLADAGAAAPVIDIPWLVLAAVVIGVPVLAALLAAAAIRKSPEVTRRAA